MKQSILDITAKYEVAHGNTADLLGQLTAKATKLEKLKAKLGMSTSLSAFLELNELKEESEDEEELLFQGTHVSRPCYSIYHFTVSTMYLCFVISFRLPKHTSNVFWQNLSSGGSYVSDCLSKMESF